MRESYLIIISAQILSLVFLSTIHSQIKEKEIDYYNWFDEITGAENSNLYEGILSVEKYATLDKSHEFFISSEYLKGNIVYDEEPYFNIDLKYDIYEDEVLLGLRSNSQILMVKLVKERIGEFIINEHRFIRVNDGEDRNPNTLGFQEVLMETSFFTLLKKHKKIKYTRYKKSRVFHKFVSSDEYYLAYEHHFYNIKNKKDIIRIFPEYRAETNKRSLESLRKTDKDKYMIDLLHIVDSRLISDKKTLQ
ncbi:hypothetical protein [Allomuricauda sp. R78024]|uniref:hypothetical protein n=1 Tax=Allomuricauda sp. R78024 TaxID=3093867 RepID=UPI0037CB24A6